MPSSKPEIAIIGGGVIGLTTAFYLAGRNISITLFEKANIGRQASWAGAGMLPPGTLSRAKTPEARLRSYSHQLWDELTDQLKRRSGIDNGYQRCGAVEVFDATNQNEFERQFAEWSHEQISVETLNRSQIEKLAPGLNPDFQAAAFLPDFGQVRNPRHIKALAVACRQMGVVIEEHCSDLTINVQNEVASIRTNDQGHDFDRILIAAGSWTQQLLQRVEWNLPVRPVRGQMVQLQVDTLPCTSVIELGRRYIVPRADGLILVGSTEEHVGFVKETTTAGVSGLLNFATHILPELSEARIARTWAGLRPGSPDELPFLGNVPATRNLFVAAGHFRSGLQMSAGTGKIMADLMTDQTPDIPLNGLHCDRTICGAQKTQESHSL